MRFPSIKAVAAELRAVKRSVDWDDVRKHSEDDPDGAGAYIDVRLQVLPVGEWQIWDGDPCYDTDHRGYWGASSLAPDSNCTDVAHELIGQAKDHAAQCDEKVI